LTGARPISSASSWSSKAFTPEDSKSCLGAVAVSVTVNWVLSMLRLNCSTALHATCDA
jgi:hypothetical protein